jgi:fatty acid desaturase
MRLSQGSIANTAAWFILVALVGFPFVLVFVWGSFGLILLGLLTLFLCTSLGLREESTPEDRAAQAEERKRSLGPLSFYRWFGVVLLAAGIAAFLWRGH